MEDLYYVGCDAEQSGVMQGEIAADYIKNHPEVDKNRDGEYNMYCWKEKLGSGWQSAERFHL